MKVGCHIPCYKMTYFLPAVLTSMSWVDRIVVTNSTKPWDDLNQQDDNTSDIVGYSELDNIELLRGNWSKDSEQLQRNMAMSALSDCDFIFLIDSDEIILIEEQKELLNFALNNPQYDGYAVNTIPYFGDLAHKALYDEGNTPLALVRPNARFTVCRCIAGPWIHCAEVNSHHLKFLQPKDQISWRLTAKHEDQRRAFKGVEPCQKSLELEWFLERCGYPNIKGELNEQDIFNA